MNHSHVILDLKIQIKNNIATHDELVCGLCDNLINEASLNNDTDSIAFGYVWKADHYFYVNRNIKLMHEYLLVAEKYIDENNPSDLLEKFYTLFRLYHLSFSDNKTSLSYCLKALNVAEAIHNELRICANLATIGEFYLDYEYYEEAFFHLNKSLEALDHNNPQNYHTMRLILISIFDCLVHIKKYDEAKEVLDKLTGIKLKKKDLKIYVERCKMIYYSYLHDEEKTNYHAQELLNEGAFEFTNPAFAFDFINHLFHSMMRIRNQEMAEKAMEMLHYLADNNTTINNLKVSSFQIELDKTFNPEKLIEDYKAYYRQYNDMEYYLKQIKVEGLNAKIALYETSLENNATNEKVKMLEQEVNIDELTNVYNRRYLNYKQTQILNDKTNRSIGFIIFDVDYFKEYNDFYGHVEGDNILKSVAGILKQACTENMNVCRYGGDEFTCICWNTTMEDLKAYIEKVQDNLYNAYIIHEHSACSDRVTLSIGYGVFELPSENQIFTFMEDVDQALYHAKKNGRNTAIALSYESKEMDYE